jgi:hypothetical protein
MSSLIPRPSRSLQLPHRIENMDSNYGWNQFSCNLPNTDANLELILEHPSDKEDPLALPQT